MLRLGSRRSLAGAFPLSVTLSSMLIDYEEDRTLRAVLVGMLREIERQSN